MTDSQVREDVLNEAKQCVLKDRNNTYGSPEDNFGRIAKLWNAYLACKPADKDAMITALDVAQMMALMKIARLAYNPGHKDSWTDLAGYAACGAGIALGEKAPSDIVYHELSSLTGVRKGVVTEYASQAIKPNEAVFKAEAQKAVSTKTFTREELKERMSNVKHYRKTDTGYIEMSLDEAVENIYDNQHKCQTPSTSSDSPSSSAQPAPSSAP